MSLIGNMFGGSSLLGSVFGPVGNAIGAIGGMALDYFGSKESASSQEKINNDQIALAIQNRDFQERMSSTAFQRAAADMKAAGINPMLAATAQESSPSGAMPGNMSAVQSPLLGLASGAKDMLRFIQDWKESNSRIGMNLQETQTSKARGYSATTAAQVNEQNRRLAALQNEALELEMKKVRDYPNMFGWMGALQKRGVGASTALDLFDSGVNAASKFAR